MKILLFYLFIISAADASLEQCGIETSSDNFKTFQSCESKKSVRQKVSCYDSINKKIKKEMKDKSVYELSPTLGNLLTEVRKSFDLNMNPKRKITYYEAIELFRTANECQSDVVSLHEYNKELDQHEVIQRSCIFSPDQKKKSLEAAKQVMTNHYLFFNSGQRLNELKKLLTPPKASSHRTEPEPLAMQDCRAGMPPGPYPPQSFTSQKKSKRKDKMNCPEWVQDVQTCGKKDEFDLSAPTLFQDIFNLGVELQLKAYSENLLTANPSKLTPGYKNKVIKRIKGALNKCFSDGTLDQTKVNRILGESLFQKKSIDENGKMTVDKIEPYFSKEGFEEFERFEAIEVAKSIKKLAVMEKYFTKVSKKLSLLNKYYQGRCGLSIWFPSWGTQSNDSCDKVKAHIDQFAASVVNPIKEQINAERNRFPFLSIPLSGGEFGSSTCFTGIVDDVIDDPLSYAMYGKFSGAVKYQQFSSASKNVHYNMACGKPLWKGAADKNLYTTKLDNYTLVEKLQDDYDDLFELTPAKGFQDRPQYPDPKKLHAVIDKELSPTNLFSEINQFQTFMDNLQNQPAPSQKEIALTAKLKREADKGLEDALTGSLQEACKNPQDYGKELLANDTIGKMYFSNNERSESDMQLYCKERSDFIAQSKMTERNLADASLGIGMLGFLHPIAAVAVLPVEFGLEYAQYREATSDKKRTLSLALFGLEDYAKADEEISTLKSEELMFYGVIGAMALGGLGDIADTFGSVAKYGRYSSRANSITKDLTTKGADHLKDFQRQIVALENSGLNDIQKRIEILENWKQLKRDLSPEDFLKLERALGDKISSIKGLLARDIKFDLVREFARSDLAMFIDDIEKLNSPAELDTLIKAYRKAKTSDEHFSEFISLLRRRGDSCGI